MGISIVPFQVEAALHMAKSAIDAGILAEGTIASEQVPYETIRTFQYFGGQDVAFTGQTVNSCGSGLFALLHYYKTLGFSNVVIQSNTMYCVKAIVQTAGMNCIVIPSDPETLIMGVKDLEQAIDTDTVDVHTVVLVSHIGGGFHPSIAALHELASRYGLPMIEDMAHALGNGVAPTGEAGVFSMYSTKSIPAGEGGIIITNKPAIQEFVSRFVVYDRHQMEYGVGLNLRVSEWQAAFMAAGIQYSEETVTSRLNMHDAIKVVLDEFQIAYLSDHGITNGYKLIVTDPRVLDNDAVIQELSAVSSSGTVFGYSLSDDIDVIPHYCFDTNYGHNVDSVDRVTLALGEIFERHLGA